MKLNTLATYDVCVIGSGPAGITFVLEYTRLNPDKTAILIEYGFKGQNAHNELDNSIVINNKVNHHDPYECTNKGLGGTSATWGGRCVMYDEVDFIDRPVVNGGCTWDLNLFNEVQQFVPKAAQYFECGNAMFNLNDSAKFKGSHIVPGFEEGAVTDTSIERWSMPTRFGKRYAKELAEQPNLYVIEGYKAHEFGEPDADGKVNTLEIHSVSSGIWMVIKSKQFVLAAGTQESTRLLLKNPKLFNKLGAVPDSLGRYYQSHLSGKIASVIFNGDPKKTDYGFLKDEDGTYLRRRFQFDTDFLVKNNLLNTAIWLDNPLYFDPAHKSGAMSFMYLAMITPVLGKKLAPPAIAHSITKGKVTGISNHMGNIAVQLPGSLTTPATIFYKRYLNKRKLPGVFLYSPQNKYALHFHSEQLPDANNRMYLAPDGEKLVIDFELNDDDILSVLKLHKVLDQQLRDNNCGKLEYWFDDSQLFDAIKQMSKDGIHQSGTTRIADSEKDGVVDTNLKVFGTENVYVCSSSVFPTSGQANPTFFLGVFAVRLANYLSNRK